MLRRWTPLLVALALLLAVAACGGDDDASDDGGTADIEAEGDTSGQRINLGGDEALTWGDGTQGVVLAHGAAFDAASWEDQGTAIAEQGATAVAVEASAPTASRPPSPTCVTRPAWTRSSWSAAAPAPMPSSTWPRPSPTWPTA